jgi:hypothetical protein
MAEAIRITPEETYQKLRAGKALLVCAYNNEERFRNLQLEEPFLSPSSGPSCLPSPKIRKLSFTAPEAVSIPLPGWPQSSTSKDM